MVTVEDSHKKSVISKVDLHPGINLRDSLHSSNFFLLEIPEELHNIDEILVKPSSDHSTCCVVTRDAKTDHGSENEDPCTPSIYTTSKCFNLKRMSNSNTQLVGFRSTPPGSSTDGKSSCSGITGHLEILSSPLEVLKLEQCTPQGVNQILQKLIATQFENQKCSTKMIGTPTPVDNLITSLAYHLPFYFTSKDEVLQLLRGISEVVLPLNISDENSYSFVFNKLESLFGHEIEVVRWIPIKEEIRFIGLILDHLPLCCESDRSGVLLDTLKLINFLEESINEGLEPIDQLKRVDGSQGVSITVLRHLLYKLINDKSGDTMSKLEDAMSFDQLPNDNNLETEQKSMIIRIHFYCLRKFRAKQAIYSLGGMPALEDWYDTFTHLVSHTFGCVDESPIDINSSSCLTEIANLAISLLGGREISDTKEITNYANVEEISSSQQITDDGSSYEEHCVAVVDDYQKPDGKSLVTVPILVYISCTELPSDPLERIQNLFNRVHAFEYEVLMDLMSASLLPEQRVAFITKNSRRVEVRSSLTRNTVIRYIPKF